jgi:hypothetical protein
LCIYFLSLPCAPHGPAHFILISFIAFLIFLETYNILLCRRVAK